jgi:hypothetical protein
MSSKFHVSPSLSRNVVLALTAGPSGLFILGLATCDRMIIAPPESALKYSAIELSRALHSPQLTAADLMHILLQQIDVININPQPQDQCSRFT